MEPQPLNSSSQSPTQIVSSNRLWLKVIPTINIVFLVISIALVFGLDLLILISSPMLYPFWIEMLIVFVISLTFIYYENFVCKHRFSKSSSKLDGFIVILVVIRNIVFVLNFIPFIQIFGAIGAVVGIIPYLIIYLILFSRRTKASKI